MSSARASSSTSSMCAELPVLFFDKFSGGFHCLHLCVLIWVISMLFQQLLNLENLPWSKAEFTLYLGAIFVGCLSFVAVLGALRIASIVVVVIALPTMVGLLLVGSLIDFY